MDAKETLPSLCSRGIDVKGVITLYPNARNRAEHMKEGNDNDDDKEQLIDIRIRAFPSFVYRRRAVNSNNRKEQEQTNNSVLSQMAYSIGMPFFSTFPWMMSAISFFSKTKGMPAHRIPFLCFAFRQQELFKQTFYFSLLLMSGNTDYV